MIRSLRAKILLGFSVIVLLVAFVASWAVMSIDEIGDRASTVAGRDLRLLEAAEEMRATLTSYHASVLREIVTPRDTLRRSISDLQRQFHHWHETSLRAGDSMTQRSLLEEIGSTFSELNASYADLIELQGALPAPRSARDSIVGTSLGRALIGAYDREFLPTYLRLQGLIGAFISARQGEQVASMNDVAASADFIATSTLVIGIAVLVLSIVACLRVLQTVLGPIEQVTVSAQRVAEGDFNHTIPERRADNELTVLVRHFNTMVRRLHEYDVRKIRQIVAEKRRCETIVQDLSDVVVAVDQDLKVIYFNATAERVTGLDARRAIGRSLAELAQESRLGARMYDDVVTGRLPLVDEIVGLRGDEEESEESYSYEAGAIEGEEDGGTIGYVFRLKDVTRFRQLDQMKSKMVSTVSHELRTPLTSIGMSLELLDEEGMRDNLDPLQRELLGNIREDVARLKTFVNDLLDLSRIESGRIRLNCSPVTPRELVERGIRQVLPLATRQGIALDLSQVGTSLPEVAADGDRITQVFVNLLTNAIRYTPYNGTIRVAAIEKGGMVELSVSDNGPGIPEEERKRVFEKFYQVRDDQRAGGSGLGLAIVKEIVEAHAGAVGVESRPGWGSRFHFTLPLADGVASLPSNDRPARALP